MNQKDSKKNEVLSFRTTKDVKKKVDKSAKKQKLSRAEFIENAVVNAVAGMVSEAVTAK